MALRHTFSPAAHGQGWKGIKPPYLALGDYRMLEPGMCFSVEPGLYDPEHGIARIFFSPMASQFNRRAVTTDVAAAVE